MITKCKICSTDLFLNYEPTYKIRCPECDNIFLPKQLTIEEMWDSDPEAIYDEDCIWDAYMAEGNKATYSDLHNSTW